MFAASLMLGLTACTSEDTATDVPADNAVRITAAVGKNTRTAPHATDESGYSFNAGDRILVSSTNTAWHPYTFDGKVWDTTDRLLWDAPQMTFRALYPGTDDGTAPVNYLMLPQDQSTAEKISGADYMASEVTTDFGLSEGTVHFDMQRLTSRVILIPNLIEKYFGNDAIVSDIWIYASRKAVNTVFNEETTRYEDAQQDAPSLITTYKRSDGSFVALTGATDENPEADFILVGIEKQDEKNIYTVRGIRPLRPGTSNTYKLDIGPTVKIADVTIQEWKDGPLWDDIPSLSPEITNKTPGRLNVDFLRYVRNAGTVTDYIKISGPINYDDLTALALFSNEYICVCDLSEAHITAFEGINKENEMPGFSENTYFTEIRLPLDLTSIRDYAFVRICGCTSLYVPANVSTIAPDAFIYSYIRNLYILTPKEKAVSFPDEAFVFDPDDTNNSLNTLHLHKSWRNDVTGGDTWKGHKWESIIFVNDDGTPADQSDEEKP